MKKEASFYDFMRFCQDHSCCNECELFDEFKWLTCREVNKSEDRLSEMNEIIVNWCEEHPVKSRQTEFLKIYPGAFVEKDGVLSIKPCLVDRALGVYSSVCNNECESCRKEYWLKEVEI